MLTKGFLITFVRRLTCTFAIKAECARRFQPRCLFFWIKTVKIYLEPDISLICDKSKMDEKGCHGAPDWIIVIVSPSSKRMDYYTKLSLNRAAGVREYWIVDPSRESVTVYFMEEDAAPVIYPFSDKIGANIYKELEIKLGEIKRGTETKEG